MPLWLDAGNISRYPPTGAGLTRRTEMLSIFAEDQLLDIWNAITLLGEADECDDVTDRSEILAEIETVLIAVVSSFVHYAEKNGNVYAFPVRTVPQ